MFGERQKAFTLVELLVVMAIVAILSSLAMSSYLNHRQRALVSSYVLPIARACMADIASHCSVNNPASGTEVYSNVLNNSSFHNCKSSTNVSAGMVNLEIVEDPACNSNGELTAGKVEGNLNGNQQVKVVCEVTQKPFRCRVE